MKGTERGQRNQHQPFDELIIFKRMWAAEVQGQMKYM